MLQFILYYLIVGFEKNDYYNSQLIPCKPSLFTFGKTPIVFEENVGCLWVSTSSYKFSRHASSVKIYGKGFYSARIKRYHSTTSSFQLMRLMVSGNISPNPGPNTSFDEARGSETRRKCLDSNIRIAHLNIHSIKNRNSFLLVKEALLKYKFDILTIGETWLDYSITDAEIWIPRYNMYRLDRVPKVGGSVCVYTKDNLKISSLNELSYIADSGLHMLWLKVQGGNLRSFLICTAYRPPNALLNCFETDFSHTLVSALLMSKSIYILGDLNCNVLNTRDPACQALLNLCSTFNLLQLITQPMRITESSATLLDVTLVSNKELIIELNVVPISISDHDLVYATLKLKKELQKPVYVNVRSFRQYNSNSFLQDMSYAPWSVINVFDDIDDKLNAFNLILNNILDLHAPIKRVKVRSRHNCS